MLLSLLVSFASVPAIIPKPVSMTVSGRAPFLIDGTTQIKDDGNLFAGRLLQDIVAKGAHIRLGKTSRLRLPGIDFEPEAGPKESYSLQVTASGIKIGYSDDAGALYAVETLRQLLPA